MKQRAIKLLALGAFALASLSTGWLVASNWEQPRPGKFLACIAAAAVAGVAVRALQNPARQ